MDPNAAYHKKKKFKDKARKIVINVFIWMVIAAFVLSLGLYYGNNQPVTRYRIAEINGRVYDYAPGTPFFYLMNNVRANMSQKYEGRGDYDSLNRDIVNYSVQQLVNNAVLHDFAERIGIRPSQEILRSILEISLGGRLSTTPDRGLLQYARMEYANYALAGETGDLVNVISVFPTSGELYAFYDLVNYRAEAEILRMDVTNFVFSRVSDSDIDAFYTDNLSNYAAEITVQEMTVKSKNTAFEIAQFASQNGWEQAVAKYGRDDKVRLNNRLVLKKESGLAKRFAAALGAKKGTVLPKPQFENGEYHVMRVTDYPALSSLPKVHREAIVADFALRNFDALRQKWDGAMKDIVGKAESLLKQNRDFRTVASQTGMSYVRTGKITPVSESIKDSSGRQTGLAFFQKPDWLEFLFTASPGQVSRTFADESSVVIFRLVGRDIAKNISYQNIGEDTLVEYMRFKNAAFNQDWTKNMKDNVKTRIFEDDIRKLYGQDGE